jgi:nitrate/nitrite transporter NarK
VADQAAPGTMAHQGETGSRELGVQAHASYGHEHFSGRPASWVAVAIIVVGFTVGGIALPVGPTWWLFWTGVGIVVIGGIYAAAIRIFNDWY